MGGNKMSKRKYRPDYGKLYPGLHLSDAILEMLKKSDRKMEYMEYDLKAERPIKDKNGKIVGMLPGREDSFERLLETDAQFISEELSPEQLLEKRLEADKLYRCLKLLDEDERALIHALFFDCLTEQEYAAKTGRKQQSINERKLRILNKLKKLLQK